MTEYKLVVVGGNRHYNADCERLLQLVTSGNWTFRPHDVSHLDIFNVSCLFS